jgi:hypothetical protein
MRMPGGGESIAEGKFGLLQGRKTYIPHIAEMIWREFPRLGDQPMKALTGMPSRRM